METKIFEDELFYICHDGHELKKSHANIQSEHGILKRQTRSMFFIRKTEKI